MSAPNRVQREAWNGDSGNRWAADADRRDRILAPIAEELLSAAALTEGENVLDLGCGCGATTIAAAERCAPGAAIGIDVSAPMLDLARQRAGDTAVFLEADAQTHHFGPGTFDVVISRFGTMFFDDPTAAFTNIARSVSAGGRLCITTWQALVANEWLLVPGTVLLRYGTLPQQSSDEPGMFAQADPTLVTRVLEQAGWRDITVTPRDIPLRLGDDGADATEYLADVGVARRVLETVAEADRATAIATVADALDAIAGPDGVWLGAGINLITATRP